MDKHEIVPGLADIYLKENNILEMRMHKTSIDIDGAIAISEAVHKLSGEIVHANLVDIRKMSFMSNEARKHFGKQDKKTVRAVAILINPTLHRPIVNLYLKFSRPTLPTRMFTDEGEAVKWLFEKLNS